LLCSFRINGLRHRLRVGGTIPQADKGDVSC
jgi:hypothetical protein